MLKRVVASICRSCVGALGFSALLLPSACGGRPMEGDESPSQQGRLREGLTLPVTAVGATDGDFTVGQGGDASYAIKLSIVPGIAGIQPDLSFVYNSAGGDSPLGVGWMLGGVS